MLITTYGELRRFVNELSKDVADDSPVAIKQDGFYFGDELVLEGYANDKEVVLNIFEGDAR